MPDYQLLTGKKPFVGSDDQVAYAICHSAVPRPSLLDPGKEWEKYDPIIEKALAKLPEDRYRSAEAFRDATLQALAAPASPTIAADTIIAEVLRPAAAVVRKSRRKPRPRLYRQPHPRRLRARH